MENNSQPSQVGGAMGKAPAAQRRAYAAARAQKARRVGPALLILCLVLALATVLLVPLLVGGASPASSKVRTMETSSAPAPSVSYSSYEEALEALGFVPALPTEAAEGYNLTAIRVVDGSMLELEYSGGKGNYLFRSAQGKDDLSGDLTEYSYTLTEEKDGAARSYAGVAEKKLSLAVWAKGDYSYAVVAADGLAGADMKQVAESVA